MRVALYSDLHLEISTWEPPAVDADVIILAGDIGSHTHGLAWAAQTFCEGRSDAPVVIYVAGNHEYYDAQLGMLAELQKRDWVEAGINFLERQVLVVGNVRFLGCTLWSGFSLYGRDKAEAYMEVAKRGINDFRLIFASGGKFLRPLDVLNLHRTAIQWLDLALSEPFDGKTVVVTHFAPHPGCVAPQHEGSDLSPYFVNDLSWLMQKHQIDLWCFGHTHTNCDFLADNGCRVVSNQRGYPSEEKLLGFRKELTLII